MNRYHVDIQRHRHNLAFTGAAIAVIILLVYSVGINDAQRIPTLAQRGWCIVCHHDSQPAIRNLAQYKRLHQRPTAADTVLLADLSR